MQSVLKKVILAGNLEYFSIFSGFLGRGMRDDVGKAQLDTNYSISFFPQLRTSGMITIMANVEIYFYLLKYNTF